MTSAPRDFLVGAIASAGGFIAVYELAYRTRSGLWVTYNSYLGLASIRLSVVTDVARVFVSLCEPLPYSLLAVVLVAFAVATRGLPLAGVVLALVLGATASTEALKPLLAGHVGTDLALRGGVGVASFPSGHSTAAMALTLSALIVTSRRWHGLIVLLGGLFCLAVSFSVLVQASHLAGDVVGGHLVACVWAMILLAGRAAWLDRPHHRQSRPGVARRRVAVLSPSAATSLLLAVGGLAAALAVIRLSPVANYTSALTDVAIAVVAITVSATGALAGVAMLLRRSLSRVA